MNIELERHLKNNRGKVSLSVLLIVSLLVFTGIIYSIQHNSAEAAAITSAKDVINNSAPGATSTHEITFTTPSGVGSGGVITITFPDAFTTGTVDFTDIDLTDDGVDVAFADVTSAALWGATTTGITSGFTLTNGTNVVAAGSVLVIQIGDNATASATGDAHFTNPGKVLGVGTADIYTISIAGGFGDTGDMLIAIIEGVTVSVTIDESLSFTLKGVSAGDCDTAFTTLAGPGTTTTTVPFGTLTAANTFVHGCQDLTISTNATSGYALTVEENRSLRDTGIPALIDDGSCDPTCTEFTQSTWSTATNNGFAYSCAGTDCVISATTNYKKFACTGATTTNCSPSGGETAQNLMTNTSGVSNSTTTIEFKLSFSGTQAAGTYNNTVTYIATPTF